MLKNEKFIIFKNLNECKKHFHENNKNHGNYDNVNHNINSFFKMIENEYDLQNVVFMEHDNNLYVIKNCFHENTNTIYFDVDNYYINVDMLFLYDETLTFSSLYNLIYNFCCSYKSKEMNDIFEMIDM